MDSIRGRIAWTGLDGHLFAALEPGGEPIRLSFTEAEFGLGGLGHATLETSWNFTQPVWSPDGRRVACIVIRPEVDDDEEPEDDVELIEEGGRITVLDLDGVQSWEVAEFEERPIFIAWGPKGAHLAILREGDGEVELGLARLDTPGEVIELTSAAPLFFDWLGQDGALLVREGGDVREGGEARLVRFASDGEEHALPLRPGGFTCPAAHPDGERVALATPSGDGSSQILIATSMAPLPILEVEGIAAMVWSPCGQFLAIASGRTDEPVFRSLQVWDALSGPAGVVFEREILAFFWGPESARLIVITVEAERHRLWVHALERDGTALGSPQAIRPTQEQVIGYQFFDQYAMAQRWVSDDGQYLLFAGIPAGHPDEGRLVPGIYAIRLDGSEPMRRLADGVQVAFPARYPTAES